MPVRALAAMTKAEFDAWVPGAPLARAGYDGLRRNAAYALGAAGDVLAIVEWRLITRAGPLEREAWLIRKP